MWHSVKIRPLFWGLTACRCRGTSISEARPLDGDPVPAASGPSARGGFSWGWDSPILREKLSTRQAPEVDLHPLGARVPLPSRHSHRGGKEGRPPGAAACPRRFDRPSPGGPCRGRAVPSRAEPGRSAARSCPFPAGPSRPGVPGAVSPPRRAPAATDGASARLETDSFCK